MKQRVVLITGGVTGIGKYTAHYLAGKGYQIIINYRNSKEKAKQLVKELQQLYPISAWAVQGDVGNLADCKSMYLEISKFCAGVDILIHNAGPFIDERKKLKNYDFHEWEYIVNGNLNAVFYLSKLFLPFMEEQRWGRIITFGFDRAETAPAWVNRSAFAAAKTALVSLTKTLSVEEASHGITVNMVCPGDIVDEWKEKGLDVALGHNDMTTPVGRPGTGEDIARVVAFLCEQESSFITGSVIPVTGGKDVLHKTSNLSINQKNEYS